MPIQTTASPLLWTPSAANAVVLTPTNVNWGNSGWIQLIASTTQALVLVALSIEDINTVTGQAEFIWGVGGLGAEQPIAEFPVGEVATLGDWTTGVNYFAIGVDNIPVGSRVSMRVRQAGTNTGSWKVAMGAYAKSALNVSVLTSPNPPTCLPSAADPIALAAAGNPSAAWANGAATLLSANPLSDAYVLGYMLDRGFNGEHGEMDLLTGPLGGETIAHTTKFHSESNPGGPQFVLLRNPLDLIRATVRLAARKRVSVANDTTTKGLKLLTLVKGALPATPPPPPPPPPVGSHGLVPSAPLSGANTSRAAYGLVGTNPIVWRVNTLSDSLSDTLNSDGTHSGSLRSALTAPYPRVIVFETSGTIVGGGTDITVDGASGMSYLTVAGQTAPSPGIQLRNLGISITNAHDVLLQHFRIRPGDTMRSGDPIPATANHDAITLYDTTGGGAVFNIVLDHMTCGWSAGKLVNGITYGGPILLWRCLLHEALYHAQNVRVSPGDPSSYALPLTSRVVADVMQCLFAHNSDRNPEWHEGAQVNFLNNVVDDWGYDSAANGRAAPDGQPGNVYPWASFAYGPNPGAWFANLVGNVYIAGISPNPDPPLYAIGTWSGDTGSQIYIHDNVLDQTQQAIALYFNNMGFDPRVGSPALAYPSGYTPLAGSSTQAWVTARCGARPLDRDSAESRIITDVGAYTGVIISSQGTVGGWPSFAVNTAAFTVPANPHDISGTGYTNLEDTLHAAAAAVEP